MDLSSHTFAYVVFGVMATINVIAATQSPMRLRDALAIAVAISFIGGIAAAIRQSRDWFVLLQFGMNTAVLGASGFMLSHIAVGESYAAQMAAIGIVGILSLGGLTASDWVRSVLQKAIELRLKRDAKENVKNDEK